jgi:phage-related protein
MAQMQALLKIKADVDGEGKVNALGRAIGGLSNTAGRVSGGLKGLAGAAGGLSGVLGSLVPIATGAGLAAMAKGAIDAADDMNDLSQKTGVSVEQLSKFQQAANASGTSIEGVGAAMIKLNKGLAAGGGPAADALKALGLSATDASGKLKSTDQVMLEVADKFAKMPDGAQKTALAMQLFGKAGADMIPLLNGGRQAVESLSATMTTKFAQGADNLNDKLASLQGKLLELGVQVGTALMPLLNGIADAVLAAANAFAAMPAPLQAIVGGIVALTAAFVILAPAISAAVSIAGALAGLQLGATIAGWLGAVGPAIAGITAAFSGLLAWIGSTLIPGLLAFFSGPVGWTVLAVAAVVAMAIAFRKPLGNFLNWLWEWGKPISNFWKNLWDGTVKLARSAVEAVKSVFTGIGAVIKGAFNGILRNIFNSINGAINNINFLINRANALSAKVRGPQLPTLPTLSVPQFAKGGVVTGPTLAMVGEGGEPEYIIPASKMAKASMNYLNGARGGAVIPAYAAGGFVGGNAQINVTTGPVLQQGGQQYVTVADLEKAMRKTADGVYASLRTPAGRYAVGVR